MRTTLTLILLTLSHICMAYDFSVDGIYYSVNKDGATVTVMYHSADGDSYQGDVVVPQRITYDGMSYKVTEVGAFAFANCHRLRHVTLPDSLKTIGSFAFSGCDSLENVTLPTGLISLGASALTSCKALTELRIPKNVTEIGNSIIEGSYSVSSITVDERNSVFDSRENCNSIIHTASETLLTGCYTSHIPDGVTSIADYAFHLCDSLKEIDIPDVVSHIGQYAFANCSKLERIHLPESIDTIPFGLFWNCVSLNDVNVPSHVVSIEGMAFSGCRSLTGVNITGGIKRIGWSAFKNCPALRVLVMGDSYPAVSYGAFDSDIADRVSLCVPDTETSTYDNATFWKDIKDKRSYVTSYALLTNNKVYNILKRTTARPLTAVTPDIAAYNAVSDKGLDYSLSAWHYLSADGDDYLFNIGQERFLNHVNELTTIPCSIDISEQEGTVCIDGTYDNIFVTNENVKWSDNAYNIITDIRNVNDPSNNSSHSYRLDGVMTTGDYRHVIIQTMSDGTRKLILHTR